MKKYLIITWIVAIILVFIFFIWQYFTQTLNILDKENYTTNTSKQSNIDIKSDISWNYLGSYYKGNYIWGLAMNLTWNELNENILHEKLQLNTADETALKMVVKLNDTPFSKSDLDKESYYVKSGYGQNTIDEINRESKKKFPSKSFGDLEMNLTPKDIISYSYFLKEVEYKTKFKEENILFNWQKVKGFISDNESQRQNIKIIKYESDDKFIIKLELKDKNDELILAKWYDMKNPQDILDEINKNNKEYLSTIGELDYFKAPKLSLDYHRDYIELIGKSLINKDFNGYIIAWMFENIKFNMDEKGARVENEAVMMTIGSIEEEYKKPKPKKFILDEPYWVVMKRIDSQNPYFILGVNNTEIMEIK